MGSQTPFTRKQIVGPMHPITDDFVSGQAAGILAKFGGVPHLAVLLKAIGKPRSIPTIYKWTYSRAKGGTGGLIPTKAWPDLLAAARMEGIFITSEDMDPRVEKS